MTNSWLSASRTIDKGPSELAKDAQIGCITN